MDEMEDMDEEHIIARECSVDEIPRFQAHIYRTYSPIHVEKRTVNDDISHRVYSGTCQNCQKLHYLGTVVERCDEPVQFFVRMQ